MDTKRFFPRAAAFFSMAALCMAMAPCAAFAEEPQLATEKVETVNVKTDATGAVESVEVDNLLSNEAAAAELLDASELTDLKGEDVEFTTTETGIVWAADGKNVSYSGKTTKQLPIQVKVTYRLNGEVVEPADIAGKSGDVSIRYDYVNNNAFQAYVNLKTVDMYTPFTCITAIMLDGDDFSGVSATNGKIINDGSDYIVTGYAMPGFKESLGSLAKNIDDPSYFEVTARTTDFELKSAMTMVTAGLLTDLDLEGMGFDDMSDASSGLSSGINELISGSNDLTGGMYELADGVDEVGRGTDSLVEGASELSNGLSLLAYGEDGETGLAGAASSSAELVKYMNKFGKSLSDLADENSGLPAVAAGLDQLAQSYPSEKDLKKLLKAIEMDEGMDPQTKAALSAIVGSTSTVKELSAATSQCAEGVGALSEGYATLNEQAAAMPEGLKAAAKAAEQLYKGASELTEGAKKLAQGVGELSEGARTAADGSNTLTEGLVTYNDEGISEVVYTIDNDLGGLKKRLNILSEESKAYDTFTGKQEGTTSSVKFVFETAAVQADK